MIQRKKNLDRLPKNDTELIEKAINSNGIKSFGGGGGFNNGGTISGSGGAGGAGYVLVGVVIFIF